MSPPDNVVEADVGDVEEDVDGGAEAEEVVGGGLDGVDSITERVLAWLKQGNVL